MTIAIKGIGDVTPCQDHAHSGTIKEKVASQKAVFVVVVVFVGRTGGGCGGPVRAGFNNLGGSKVGSNEGQTKGERAESEGTNKSFHSIFSFIENWLEVREPSVFSRTPHPGVREAGSGNRGYVVFLGGILLSGLTVSVFLLLVCFTVHSEGVTLR